MAFTGRYEMERVENGDETKHNLGIPEDLIKANHGKKVITEIYQNDDFRMTKFLSGKTWTDTFTIGKECEMETVTGIKFKTTVTLDEGKLRIQFPKAKYTAEMDGDKLIEVTSTPDSAVPMKTISRRI